MTLEQLVHTSTAVSLYGNEFPVTDNGVGHADAVDQNRATHCALPQVVGDQNQGAGAGDAAEYAPARADTVDGAPITDEAPVGTGA